MVMFISSRSKALHLSAKVTTTILAYKYCSLVRPQFRKENLLIGYFMNDNKMNRSGELDLYDCL